MIYTKKNIVFLKLFKKLGVISSFYLIKNSFYPLIRVYLFFIKNFPLFYNFKIISKPSKPVYISYFSLNMFNFKMGQTSLVLSTSYGIITSQEALLKKCGGELLGFF